MNTLKRISEVYEASEKIPFDDTSRFVIISDCHRGDGSWADNFAKNQNIYYAALTHYYDMNYTYVELGDGDELWENNKLCDIIHVHIDVFRLLSKFYMKDRLYLLYGNHDIVKRNKKFVKKNLYQYFNEREKMYVPLFPGIKIHEGLILNHSSTKDKIFLLHGHQVDWLNSTAWRMARFLVNYFWKPLELFGVNDPTSTAKNYKKKAAVGERLTEWAEREQHIIIAGHTHRPTFPEVGKDLYFNDGSCVHPRCITAIEIVFGRIRLVKWSVKTKDDGTLYIGRDVLAGPRRITDYFQKK
jgi:UDP-2,3-diacylglucosamine pyrophosphatase LpxH